MAQRISHSHSGGANVGLGADAVSELRARGNKVTTARVEVIAGTKSNCNESNFLAPAVVPYEGCTTRPPRPQHGRGGAATTPRPA